MDRLKQLVLGTAQLRERPLAVVMLSLGLMQFRALGSDQDELGLLNDRSLNANGGCLIGRAHV